MLPRLSRYLGFVLAGITAAQTATVAVAQIQAMPPSNLATMSGSASAPGNALVAPDMSGGAMVAPRPSSGGLSLQSIVPNNEPFGYPGTTSPAVGLPVGGWNCWDWQLLPNTTLYKTYLAGIKEPRLGSQWVHLKDFGWVWDLSAGARVGLLRYGSHNDIWPEGWQLDVEGAAFPRLDLDHERDMISTDFRAGVPLTWRRGPWEAKFGYYHVSSHIGDEFLLRNPTFDRLNYVRESLLFGIGLRPLPDWRIYYEVGYAFYVDGGALPWEFQFGLEYSSPEPTSIWGAPFAAVNSHLRQDNDFSGNFTVEAGWQWRGQTGHLLRFGAQYFNGMSEQYQFFHSFEEQIGLGLWYDF